MHSWFSVRSMLLAWPAACLLLPGCEQPPRGAVEPGGTAPGPARACVSLTVRVPPGTPADAPVNIVGNDDRMGPWLPGRLTLEDRRDGTRSTRLCFDQGKELQYKYVRSGDWSKVEKNADGSERANRTLTVTEDTSRTDTVEKWADL